jgi:adenine-specific DNA glycosylase
MIQRPASGLWASFWEFPTRHVSGADPAARAQSDIRARSLATYVKHLTGLETRIARARPTDSCAYSVTRYRMRLQARLGQVVKGELRPHPTAQSARWISTVEGADFAMSAPTRKLFDKLRLR